jgi:starch phosphorylase
MRVFVNQPRIAYFSMEVGIESAIPTYSGGLGVLAGDTVRSCADLRIPLISVTLVSRKGYLRQRLSPKGEQQEFPQDWNPTEYTSRIAEEAEVTIGERPVKIGAWLYEYQSLVGGIVPILFLDTDVEGNTPEDRRITDLLYGGDDAYRLKQEIVLGIGGVRILDALGLEVRNYHMNEGHSSLLTLELLKKNGMDANRVRNQCIFTTHTPVEAGHDKWNYTLVHSLLNHELPVEQMKPYGGGDCLNMSSLALNLSKYINGVTKAHTEFSKSLFPGHRIRAVTNGVHSYTWTSAFFRELYDKYIPGWANEPELLVRVDDIPNDEIYVAHMKAKANLIFHVNQNTDTEMDLATLTLGFARRATSYKRSTFLFSDIERLKKVCTRESKTSNGNLQIIFAGKAHARDIFGKSMIRQIYEFRELLGDHMKIAYLEDYDMEIGKKLTSGVDVWLNTPLPPYEASGTSGMKAAHNGVLNFSILDGWWIEGCIEGITGWSIGPSPNGSMTPEQTRTMEVDDFYNKLEYLIIPKFYNKRDEWLDMMKQAIMKIAYYFNSHRMMRRYVTDAYLL